MRMKCTLFSANAVLMKVIPVGGLIHGSDMKHRLRTGESPSHAAPLHAILDQVSASSLDDSGRDRVARRQVFVIMHAMIVYTAARVAMRRLPGRSALSKAGTRCHPP